MRQFRGALGVFVTLLFFFAAGGVVLGLWDGVKLALARKEPARVVYQAPCLSASSCPKPEPMALSLEACQTFAAQMNEAMRPAQPVSLATCKPL
jgi:hypothetical protein